MAKKRNFKKLTNDEHAIRALNPILDMMENGDIPWQKNWDVRRGGNLGAITIGTQRNADLKNYSGINAWILETEFANKKYDTNVWFTSNRMYKKTDGKVFIRKGERATYVFKWVFTDIYEGESDCPKCKGKVVYIKRGYKNNDKPCTHCKPNKRLSIKTYSSAVFNVSQFNWTKEVPMPKEYKVANPKTVKKPTKKEEPKRVNKVIKKAQVVVDAYGSHLAGGISDENLPSDGAYYTPSRDGVVMPARNQFHTPEGYYRVMFHELAHSTGHKSRLNRFKEYESHMFGSSDYSKEEFVAEMSACLTSSFLGVDTKVDMENSGAYLRSWKKSLKDHAQDIPWAINKAIKATELILNTKKKVVRKTKKKK